MKRFNTAKLAMAMFIGSEVVFFGFLIASFIYYRANAAPAVYGNANVLDPARTLIFTFCLLSSSGTLWLAERRLAAAHTAGFRRWLIATIVLGAAFIGGQAWEYIGLVSKLIVPGRNLFAASFFTLTGFHGFHVCCGLISLGVLLLLTFRGNFGGREISGVGAVSMYWHFVDAVWIAIYSLVYLTVWL